VALKNALAYDRDVAFDEPDEKLARRAWGQNSPSAAERKAFSDFIVDRLCALAAERDIPMQMHLGTAILRGSHPLKAAGLVERHPRTRFLLMHLAYPWSRDLLGMAFVYRNIWLDLTWSLLLSPSHFKLALHEAIEVLPDESRLMIGGDNWHVEETYGTLKLARQLIGDVLEEKVSAGYFRLADAQRLAARILRENALCFFR
jgi:predicted TIM-barrel fold metal-dependent hydrolase